MKWVPIILSVTLKFNWAEAQTDPPLSLWRARSVKSVRFTDGGEILAFDYAQAVGGSESKSKLLFFQRKLAL